MSSNAAASCAPCRDTGAVRPLRTIALALTIGCLTPVLAALSATNAALSIVRDRPATVRGRGFHPDEPVRVTLHMGTHVWIRATHGNTAGAFLVAFTGVRLDYCAIPFLISARGSRTGVVVANPPIRDCAAP